MSDPLQVGDEDALAGRLDDAIPGNVIPPAALPNDAEDDDREANFEDDAHSASATATDDAATTNETTSTTVRTARTTIRQPAEEEETTTEATTTSTDERTTSTSEETSSATPTRRVLKSTIDTTSTTEESTTSETTTTSPTSTETSTSIADKTKHTTRETTRETGAPVPTRLPSKPASKDDDGLGTGTTIGIALAAAAGIGILLLLLGALLKWRQKRNVAKRTAGLANFADINDFADSTTKKNPIDLANEKEAQRFSAPDTNAIPVTPPYRPEIRQAQKRNSWVDDRGLPDDPGFGDYTVQPGPPIPSRAAVEYGGQPAYGASRSGMPLPGMFDTPPGGGAFDPLRMESGYGHHAIPERQDTFSNRAAAPVRNRHFPPAPGRAFTSENPYPYMPTGHR